MLLPFGVSLKLRRALRSGIDLRTNRTTDRINSHRKRPQTRREGNGTVTYCRNPRGWGREEDENQGKESRKRRSSGRSSRVCKLAGFIVWDLYPLSFFLSAILFLLYYIIILFIILMNMNMGDRTVAREFPVQLWLRSSVESTPRALRDCYHRARLMRKMVLSAAIGAELWDVLAGLEFAWSLGFRHLILTVRSGPIVPTITRHPRNPRAGSHE